MKKNEGFFLPDPPLSVLQRNSNSKKEILVSEDDLPAMRIRVVSSIKTEEEERRSPIYFLDTHVHHLILSFLIDGENNNNNNNNRKPIDLINFGKTCLKFYDVFCKFFQWYGKAALPPSSAGYYYYGKVMEVFQLRNKNRRKVIQFIYYNCDNYALGSCEHYHRKSFIFLLFEPLLPFLFVISD